MHQARCGQLHQARRLEAALLHTLELHLRVGQRRLLVARVAVADATGCGVVAQLLQLVFHLLQLLLQLIHARLATRLQRRHLLLQRLGVAELVKEHLRVGDARHARDHLLLELPAQEPILLGSRRRPVATGVDRSLGSGATASLLLGALRVARARRLELRGLEQVVELLLAALQDLVQQALGILHARLHGLVVDLIGHALVVLVAHLRKDLPTQRVVLPQLELQLLDQRRRLGRVTLAHQEQRTHVLLVGGRLMML
eukprot:scaffold7389_cov220-Pinguiococcus_pyrenoidosus.AAC.1